MILLRRFEERQQVTLVVSVGEGVGIPQRLLTFDQGRHKSPRDLGDHSPQRLSSWKRLPGCQAAGHTNTGQVQPRPICTRPTPPRPWHSTVRFNSLSSRTNTASAPCSLSPAPGAGNPNSQGSSSVPSHALFFWEHILPDQNLLSQAPALEPSFSRHISINVTRFFFSLSLPPPSFCRLTISAFASAWLPKRLTPGRSYNIYTVREL